MDDMDNSAIENTKASLPILHFKDAAAFEAWLVGRGTDDAGAWLKLVKKGSGIPGISRQEAVDVALCHGWIDGQANTFDADFFLIRFTPRRARSKWSKINVERVAELIAAGKMTDRGLAEIERAKADGRWDAAYDPPSRMTAPDDLTDALNRSPEAAAFFATLNSQNRFAILHRIHDAKKPETRAARITKFVEMLARGETVYPQKKT